MRAACANLMQAQDRLRCYPPCEIGVDAVGPDGRGEEFMFWMGPSGTAIGDNYLRCSLPIQLLRDILDRKAHWNSAEVGCLIRFHRTGFYMPDVHTLMSFFHLPR